MHVVLQWGWWSVTHQITMEVAITSAFFLTVFYWLVLVFLLEYDVTIDVNTFMKHGANCLLALLEVVLTRIPFVSYHFLVRSQHLSVWADSPLEGGINSIA